MIATGTNTRPHGHSDVPSTFLDLGFSFSLPKLRPQPFSLSFSSLIVNPQATLNNSEHDKVVDIFIPKDRRTGDSRKFTFVCYKYADKAQKFVDRLNGHLIDGREITVQFTKYAPNAERIHKGRIVKFDPRSKHSRSPPS